ncbi:hypothetical protein Z043_125402, partial [Scleropages formosus]
LKDDGCRVTQGNQLKTPPPSDGNPVSEKKGGSARKRRCKAAFSYTPQNNDELELKVGDIIEIVGEVEEGWWEGSLNGKIGMFPSNFTKELDEAEDPPKDTPEPLQDGTDASNSVKVGPGTANEEDESSSAKSTESSKIQPKKVRGIGFGDIFKDQPIKLRPRSMELDGEAEKVSTTSPPRPRCSLCSSGITPLCLGVSQQQQVVKKPSQATSAQESAKVEINGKVKANEFCKVLFPYEAQNEDELSIREGDIVAVISKECADTGWWLGELDGRRGVFPDNFVKLLVAEGEKERPKKPPPPGSSATKPLTGNSALPCLLVTRSDSKAEDKKVPPERPESLPQRGEEKGPPAIPPKKPLPPKTNNSHGRPSFLPTKPPQRPERPPVPRI